MDKKFIIGVLAATFVILVGAIYLIQKTRQAQVSTSASVSLETDSRNFDWGQIPYAGGDASKNFSIKNKGTEVLKLYNVKTSCACTNAFLSIDGVESPQFGMHTTSGWVGEVRPGGEAVLGVVFDPDFHGPGGVGAISRTISVQTNDEANPKIEFTLTGTVVK